MLAGSTRPWMLGLKTEGSWHPTPQRTHGTGPKEKENPGPGFTSSAAPESTYKDQKLPKIFSNRSSGQMQ